MNDRFKFRVWDKPLEKYMEFKEFRFMNVEFTFNPITKEAEIEYDKERYIVEQCTGLKDINGNFIYENDIVVWNDGGGEVELKPKEGHVRIAKVQLFPDLHFKLVGGYPKGTYTMWEEFHFGNFIYKNTEKYLKIVGNIHENKELLNER